MPSQQVLDGLSSLQSKLDQLSPAIRHIEAAEKVTTLVKDINQHHQKLMGETESSVQNFLTKAQQKFDDALAQIEQAHSTVAIGLESLPKNIRQDFFIATDGYRERLSTIVAEHKTSADEAAKQLTFNATRTDKVSSALGHQLDSLRESTLRIEGLLTELEALRTGVKTFPLVVENAHLETRSEMHLLRVDVKTLQQAAETARLEVGDFKRAFDEEIAKVQKLYSQAKDDAGERATRMENAATSRQVILLVVMLVGFLALAALVYLR